MNFASLDDLRAPQSLDLAEDILLQPPSKMKVPTPAAVASDSDDHELQIFWAFESARVCQFKSLRLSCLTNAYISPEGPIFLGSGQCLIETIYPWEKSNYSERFPRISSDPSWLAREREAASKISEAVHLREPGESGYFHWINSVLPRLCALQRFSSLRGLPLAVDSSKKFAAESMDLAGVDAAQALPRGLGYQCDRLWVFTPTVVEGNHFTRAPYWTEEVRRTFLTHEPPRTPRHIYLSRSDASVRSIVNEVELRRLLESRGFESITVGDMAFAKQVALFGSCSVLLSAHGAGISNAIFMHSGRVIEIISRTRPWPTFRTLAARSGLEYAGFVSKTVELSDGHASTGNEAIELDLPRFTAFLDQALQRDAPQTWVWTSK